MCSPYLCLTCITNTNTPLTNTSQPSALGAGPPWRSRGRGPDRVFLYPRDAERARGDMMRMQCRHARFHKIALKWDRAQFRCKKQYRGLSASWARITLTRIHSISTSPARAPAPRRRSAPRTHQTSSSPATTGGTIKQRFKHLHARTTHSPRCGLCRFSVVVCHIRGARDCAIAAGTGAATATTATGAVVPTCATARAGVGAPSTPVTAIIIRAIGAAAASLRPCRAATATTTGAARESRRLPAPPAPTPTRQVGQRRHAFHLVATARVVVMPAAGVLRVIGQEFGPSAATAAATTTRAIIHSKARPGRFECAATFDLDAAGIRVISHQRRVQRCLFLLTPCRAEAHDGGANVLGGGAARKHLRMRARACVCARGLVCAPRARTPATGRRHLPDRLLRPAHLAAKLSRSGALDDLVRAALQANRRIVPPKRSRSADPR